jgi:hypothetical protein
LFAYRVSVSVIDLEANAMGFSSCNNIAPRPDFDASQLTGTGFVTSKYVRTGSLVKISLIRCEEVGLTLNPEKCQFTMTEVTYIGHELGKDGISPDP